MLHVLLCASMVGWDSCALLSANAGSERKPRARMGKHGLVPICAL